MVAPAMPHRGRQRTGLELPVRLSRQRQIQLARRRPRGRSEDSCPSYRMRGKDLVPVHAGQPSRLLSVKAVQLPGIHASLLHQRRIQPVAVRYEQSHPLVAADINILLPVAVEIADDVPVLRAEMPAADPVLVLRRIARHPDLVEPRAGRQEQAGPQRAADENIGFTVPVEITDAMPILRAEMPAADPVLVLRRIACHPDLVEPSAGREEQAGPLRAAGGNIGFTVPVEITDVMPVLRAEMPAADPVLVLCRIARHPDLVEPGAGREQQAGPQWAADEDILQAVSIEITDHEAVERPEMPAAQPVPCLPDLVEVAAVILEQRETLAVEGHQVLGAAGGEMPEHQPRHGRPRISPRELVPAQPAQLRRHLSGVGVAHLNEGAAALARAVDEDICIRVIVEPRRDLLIAGLQLPLTDPVPALGRIAAHPFHMETVAAAGQNRRPLIAADENIGAAVAVEVTDEVTVAGAQVPAIDPVFVLGRITGHPDIVEATPGRQQQAGPMVAADKDIGAAVAIEVAHVVLVSGAEMPAADPVLVLRRIAGHPDILKTLARGEQQGRPLIAADKDIGAAVAIEVAHVVPIVRAEMPATDPVPVLCRIAAHPHAIEAAAGRPNQAGPLRAADEDIVAAVAVEVADIFGVVRAQVPGADPVLVLCRIARHPDFGEALAVA